jgi:phosphoglycolate phosphatase
MIRLVVFDLDGTLVDSSRDLADATNAMLLDFGGTTLSEEIATSLVGHGAAVLVRRALERAGLDADTPNALERFLIHYDARLLDTTRPYPGMVETVAALGATRRNVVLTNKPEEPSRQILRGLDMGDLFRDVIGGDSPYGRKPDPAGLLALVERAGVTVRETMMVGDSPVDLETARRAGTHVCLARYGSGYRPDETVLRDDEHIVDDPRQIAAVVESL